VAQVYTIRLTGFPGWLAHRAYHLLWLPTPSLKARVLADWTVALFFRREIAPLSSLEHPADDFRDALLTSRIDQASTSDRHNSQESTEFCRR
jgi:NADH:ubiquinone reductase (H+-translocating)